MAAHPILIVDDELLHKLPEEFRRDPRFQKGASLELVPVAPAQENMSGRDVMATWESLRGILANSDYYPNAELEKEKQRELEEEARWSRS